MAMIVEREVSGYKIRGEAYYIGEDVLVIVAGGDEPHIGALGVAARGASKKNPNQNTTTLSLITIPGHKETQLAQSAAQRLSEILDKTVVVCVGIHINNITKELIDEVIEVFQYIIGDLQEVLEKNI